MDYRTPILLVGLTLLLSFAYADSIEADWQMRLQRASAMQAEAEARQKAADDEFARRKSACQEKYLVNDCISRARALHVAASRDNRRQIIEAGALEREVRREQSVARTASIAAENERRNRELPTRAQAVAEERQRQEGERQKLQTDKQRKAEVRAKKQAERTEAHRRKLAEREARLAERKARAERRAERE